MDVRLEAPEVRLESLKLTHMPPAPPPSLRLRFISRRYSERDVLAEAEPIFPNTVVARDFDRFRIVKEK